MPERKRRRKVLLIHAILLPTLLFAYSFFFLSPRSWTGVDEAVVGKIAGEHGRQAKPPLINTDRGDLLLFVFLVGGVVAGFAAGTFWQQLLQGRRRDTALPATSQAFTPMTYGEIVTFHGHECPGLAKGYRMALAALDALGVNRAGDEELVAIVENDACGVDALQCVTGCTFGKGNLLFRDYGKSVFSLFSRTTGQGVRVEFHGRGVPAGRDESKKARADVILAAPTDALLTISPATEPAPARAMIRSALPCARCGELVMETRLRQFGTDGLCIPCAERRDQPR